MKELMHMNKEQTMSSREIAELTGKDHHHVVKAIENTLEQAGISTQDFASSEEVRGKQVVTYNLPKLECDLVITGYSVKYRLAVLKRWQALENKELSPLEILKQQVQFMERAEDRFNDHDSRLTILETPKRSLAGAGAYTCEQGYWTLSRMATALREVKKPIAYSTLVRFSEFYESELRSDGKCFNKADMSKLLNSIFQEAVEDGAFMVDPSSGFKFKADWLKW